jgi:hypothetical protein
MGVAPLPCGGVAEAEEAAKVSINNELVGGQAEAGEPLGQLSGVVERISRFSGVGTQVAPSGSPEQEIETDIGAANAEVNSTDGVTVTVADPDWPGVRVSVPAVVDEGVILEIATENSHSVATLTRIAGADVEAA